MSKRIVFTGKKEVRTEEFDLTNPGKGEVLIRSCYSLMSTGTENIVFNRLFEPGTHWDAWVKYPFYPGYAIGGIIEKAGSEVTTLKVGDKVVVRKGHASHCIASEKECTRVPNAVDLKDAIWFALAKIAFLGARAAEYTLGDSVLIIGAGPIGQMSARWARAAGVGTILVADSVEARLQLAKRGGATHTFGKSIDECIDDVKAATNRLDPRVVIDGTGNPKVFATSLKIARRFGRVIILGDTGTPTQQHLTADLITKGLSIVGAHDTHDDGSSIYPLFFNLIESKRFDLSGLNTNEFSGDQSVEAYETANARRGETMGIVFDWSKNSSSKITATSKEKLLVTC
jgi:2-desacetyl-2-hydroxyethyl bacteriochlorophyllide A dehydrogenase